MTTNDSIAKVPIAEKTPIQARLDTLAELTELTALPQWVVWRLEDHGKPKPDKVPYNPATGGKAQTNNPTTWGTFDQARARYAAAPDQWDGLGFVFAAADGLVFVDFDDCLDAGGEMTPWAKRQVGALCSYTERSVSGKGLHIILYGDLPPKGRKKGDVEVYDSGRFCALTGDLWPGAPLAIHSHPDALLALHREVFGDPGQEPPPRAPQPVALSDRDLLDKAFAAKNGDAIRALWDGDTSGYPSQSEADLALCGHLAFYCGGDPGRVDRLFRQSGLHREKWDQRHSGDGQTYGQLTIHAALSGRTDFYAPNGGAAVPITPITGTPIQPQDKPAPPPERYPSLPESARLPDNRGIAACSWLDRYIEFSREWSPRAFDGFHEAIGLWLLSVVAARRVCVHFGGRRFPSLYIALAGRTTVHAKTTTTGIGYQTLKMAGLDFLLASDESTPQSFLRALAIPAVPPSYYQLDEDTRAWVDARLAFRAQRGWYCEEFGSWLSAMVRKDGVMADFRGLLRKFDDGLDRYSRDTISRGVEVVEKPYLSLLANLTPADIKPLAGKGAQLWGDGFLARFAFITPPENEVRTGQFPKGERIIPPDLVKPLADWHQRLGVPTVTVRYVVDSEGNPTNELTADVAPLPTHAVGIDPDVWTAFYHYDDAVRTLLVDDDKDDLDGSLGRLGEKALRIAALLASFTESDQITMTHWARAQAIVERWRQYLYRLYDQVTRADKSERAEREDQILDVLRKWQGTEKYADGMTANDIARFVWNLGAGEVAEFLDDLTRAQVICKHSPKRATRYFIPGAGVGEE